MKFIYIVILGIFFISGCTINNRIISEGEIPVIFVDVDRNSDEILDLQAITEDEWELVALETTEESLIGYIEKIIYYKDHYYIQDRSSPTLFVFDKQGRFTGKIADVGQGPNEYLTLSTFTIADDYIWLGDYLSKKISCYDLSLKPVRQINIPLSVQDLEISDRKIYMATNWWDVAEENVQLACYDPDNNELTPLLYVPQRNMNAALETKDRQLASAGKTCLFIHSYCDTIFRAAGDQLEAAYRIAFSDRYQDEPFMPSSGQEGEDVINGIYGLYRIPGYIAFTYIDKWSLVSVLYNEEEEKTTIYKQDQIIHSGLGIKQYVFQPINDRYLITQYPPELLLEYYENVIDREMIKPEVDKRFRELISQIDIESNPVLLRLRVKE